MAKTKTMKQEVLHEMHKDAISQYLSGLSQHSLFTAEDEQRTAHLMFAAEEACWALVVSTEKAAECLKTVLLERVGFDELLQTLAIKGKTLVADLKKVDEDRKLLSRTMVLIRAESRFEGKCDILKQHRKAMKYRNDFIQANLRLVVNIARKFHHHKMPLVDLIQEGNLGLIKGVYRFDPRKGFRFSTYAHWWIRQAIERAIMNKACDIRIPVHIYDARREMRKAEKFLFSKLEREAAIEEVAEMLGVSVEKIHYLKAVGPSTPKSLDEQVGDSDHRTLAESIEDVNQVEPEQRAIDNDQNAQVQSIFKFLTVMEKDIIARRFGMSERQNETLEQIGKSYNLSRERVRQIQVQGLKKMQKHCERRCIAI